MSLDCPPKLSKHGYWMALLENTIAIVCNTIFEPMRAGVEMTKVMFAVYISKVNTASEIFYILKVRQIQPSTLWQSFIGDKVFEKKHKNHLPC